jgi:hypothetical protein
MPVPVHEPPGAAADKVTDVLLVQKGPAAVIVGSGDAATLMLIFDVEVHVPTVTE